jgi:hypothetical protein
MIFLDPVTGIGQEELTHRAGVRTIEVNRLAPLVLVPIGEIGFREKSQRVSVRTKMIVHDVENNGDAERMRSIDKATEVVRPTIEPCRRKEVYPVITPAEPAGELRDRHDFDTRDAKTGERCQLAGRRLPRPLPSEGADVQFIDDELLPWQTVPFDIRPAEGVGVNDLRRAVWSVGLIAGLYLDSPDGQMPFRLCDGTALLIVAA